MPIIWLLCSLVDELDQTQLGIDSLYVYQWEDKVLLSYSLYSISYEPHIFMSENHLITVQAYYLSWIVGQTVGLDLEPM
jgi:hypothetical protein